MSINRTEHDSKLSRWCWFPLTGKRPRSPADILPFECDSTKPLSATQQSTNQLWHWIDYHASITMYGNPNTIEHQFYFQRSVEPIHKAFPNQTISSTWQPHMALNPVTKPITVEKMHRLRIQMAVTADGAGRSLAFVFYRCLNGTSEWMRSYGVTAGKNGV